MASLLLALLAVLLALGESAPLSEDSTVAEIRRRDVAKEAAMNAWDVDAYEKFYADSAVIISNGERSTKDEMMANMRSRGAVGKGHYGVQYSPVEIRPLGDMAIESASYITTYDGEPLEAGKYSLIWQKIDGVFVIVLDQDESSVLPSVSEELIERIQNAGAEGAAEESA